MRSARCSSVRATSKCRRTSLRSGCSMSACLCGFRFSCTNISGATRRGVSFGLPSHLLFELLMQKAVVLVSGGLDSATTLAIAREQQLECHALSVDYGQRHRAELEAAAR